VYVLFNVSVFTCFVDVASNKPTIFQLRLKEVVVSRAPKKDCRSLVEMLTRGMGN